MPEEYPQILESLGFIIAPNGEYFEYGIYKPWRRRNDSDPNHFHDRAFKKDVLDTDRWKKLNIQGIEPGDARYKIPKLTKRGIIVALNITGGNWDPLAPEILFASPVAITEEQAATLMEHKEMLSKYDTQISIRHISLIDKNITEMPLNSFSDYYNNFVIPLVQEETPKRG